MSDHDAILAQEQRIFDAIRSRDATALGRELAADFVHSTMGGEDQDRGAFLQAIAEMPYAIQAIGGEDLRCRVMGEVAVLSGVQRATVRLPDGQEVVDASRFVDLFVRADGGWLLRHAVTVPGTAQG